MTDPQVDSTRVFVKGLPPSFTSDQLASHFRQQYTVTDAHVFPERRIGFVGFHDRDSAQNAVKHFHRTYIRMSKISVDLARPVEVKRDSSGQAVPVSKRSASYPSRKNGTEEPQLKTHNDITSRKRKREEQEDGERQRRNEDADASLHALNQEAEGGKTTEQNVKDDNGEVLDPPSTKSDNDWLRGKTSRLLDLIEPDEIAGVEPVQENKLQSVNEPSERAQVSGKSVETGGEGEETQTIPNGRLFIRNLAFDVTDTDLEDRFSQFGKLQEAHVVKDARKSTSKGLAYLQFAEPEAAGSAMRSLDGVSFHGRLLHILPASDKRDQTLTEFDISKMPLKKQKAIRKKKDASSAIFSWNSLYMNPDAVISSIADRLGVSKSDILDPTSSDAAVKQAHAETQLIAETKEYLRANGVLVDAFKNKQRDDRIILLKNFPFGTSESDLRNIIEPFGLVSKFLFPPAGTMALVQFDEPYSASQALKQLAYKNIKGSVLYLEKAPRGLLDEKIAPKIQVSEEMGPVPVEQDGTTSKNTATLFVRNLNFSTTTARLTEAFGVLPGFLSARVKTRVDPKRPGEILSMGFGFVEFQNKAFADTAVATLNAHRLDGHELVVQASNKASDLAEERRRGDNVKKSEANKTKIIIKNLPFQASSKDVRSLFAQYGQLKKVRVPKKFDNTSRGFGFAEFVTAKEAQNAMDALASTHLLGRRLVLEFTEEEEIDPEEQIQAMERKMEQQNNRVQLSKLAGTGRKKFVLGLGEEE